MSDLFRERMKGLLNAGALSTVLGVASRVGLLGAIAVEPSTASQIAKRAGLHRRYVEEMLAALACGDIVVMARAAADSEVEPLYSMPPDRKNALDGFLLYFEELPLLIRCAFDEVVRDAREGQGVAQSNYRPFGAWMGKLADQKHEAQLIGKFIPALGDDIVRSLQSPEGGRILDMGCGEGTAACLMAKAFPSCRVIGVDSCAASVEAAAAKARQQGLPNAEFRVGDAADLAGAAVPSGAFDLVTAFDVIHDLSDPAGALREARRALKPGGAFAMVDIRAHTSPLANAGHPLAPFLYAVSLLHCMPQGLLGGGPGLGMMWGRERALDMVGAAGLEARVLELDFDAFNDCFLCRSA